MAEMAVGMGPNFVEVMWIMGPLELGVRGVDPSQPIEVAALALAAALARRAVITKLRSRLRECPADRRTGVPLRPMRARRPEARFAMLSTAWSRTDPFWMVWAGDDQSWIRLKATADTVHYDPKFLEQERRSLGEDAFKREYFGVPLGAQTSPFTWEL
jgi:hypothetical protein